MNTLLPSGPHASALGCAVMTCLLLAGCAGNSPRSGGYAQQTAATERCTDRVVVTMRRGRGLNNDFEIIENSRRAGVTMEIEQTMTREERMVKITANGPESICEEAIERLRANPNVERVQR